MQPDMQNPWVQYNSMMMPPVVKKYEIATTGPADQHEMLNMIYEDVMPTKPSFGTYVTIGERVSMHDLIRSSVFNSVDGNDIRLNGKSYNSLLSQIKFNELNPYKVSKVAANPYDGLPLNYLIYRSCYPIRLDQGTKNVSCSKDSTSVNVKIYRMTQGSYNVNKFRKTFISYDEWVDVAYYEYVRDNIFRTKASPNFVNMYGYFLSEKAGIDFEKINRIQSKKVVEYEPVKGVGLSKEITVNPHENIEDKMVAAQLNGKVDGEYKELTINPRESIMGSMLSTQITNQQSGDKYIDKAMVIITESPTSSLLGWATKKYNSDPYQISGEIMKMTNSGYHNETEWCNVLFQIMSAMYVMQTKEIVVNDFSIKNNIFIKELSSKGAVTNYWIYNIDGFEYFIPNEGVLVMIDCNPTNKVKKEETLVENKKKLDFKIDGAPLGDYTQLTHDDIINKTFSMFCEAIDPSVFSNEYVSEGGCRPPMEILQLMNTMVSEARSIRDKKETNGKNISDFILKYMSRYLSSRVGTYLQSIEIANVRPLDYDDLKKGRMVVNDTANGEKRFVIYVDTRDGKHIVFTKENASNKDFIYSEVPMGMLSSYSKAEPIINKYNPIDPKMGANEALEIYVA